MAETKGMTIEFSADISKLQSDLKKVDAASKKPWFITALPKKTIF